MAYALDMPVILDIYVHTFETNESCDISYEVYLGKATKNENGSSR